MQTVPSKIHAHVNGYFIWNEAFYPATLDTNVNHLTMKYNPEYINIHS